MNTNVQNSPAQIMQVIQQTAPTQIAELDLVKEKFIKNYNVCHGNDMGELMYHRQLVHFKQTILNSEDLRNCDPFSVYACFLTAAVKGYSFDPQDDEVYLVPRGGKACLQRQAGAYVRRLMSTNQIKFADQAKLVYHGDEFEVERGRVLRHVEKFQTDTIVAAYIRFVIDEKGNERYFIYRKSDWESWKKKSPQKNGANWTGNNGQPEPGFLRTKIVLHACKEKSWAIGVTPVNVEQYEDVEYDIIDDEIPDNKGVSASINSSSNGTSPTPNRPDDDSFANGPKPQQGGTITMNDDEF